ncbi:hypothetical protein A3F07_02465 [candidate division WWE3 bacterium RIFCSPHIGHO2_12_FULL_38_15]|uniref:SpoVT-AbrB domain-containing protein n=1 Tax=candidate division WWE3 bacterium RIFCSPHIGHO2_02_FULL_38_14 TaxID=1802620 RepID=A0A1F4V6Q0_UNCKA|nr:MAG: hypothetical protein A3F07_02465 [candidate division WWE3 bacterium RIFCSPHIGHO2_12_FULL_38_15]OGC52680.1 MAG: hypothetical protein A3D91_03345 [candidate division WWE3 bacterium RIFCSPHIGHO2_02_FULL_38_14]
MVFKQKLTKIGNSIGVIFPKEIRDLLGIDLGSEVYIQPGLDEKTLIVNVKEPTSKVDPQFFELVKKVTRQYSNALRELSKK